VIDETIYLTSSRQNLLRRSVSEKEGITYINWQHLFYLGTSDTPSYGSLRSTDSNTIPIPITISIPVTVTVTKSVSTTY
jgi:hypothetical protein